MRYSCKVVNCYNTVEMLKMQNMCVCVAERVSDYYIRKVVFKCCINVYFGRYRQVV